MEVQSLSYKEYSEIFSSHYHAYNLPAFNQLNGEIRRIPVQYIGFKTKKYKLGIIGGVVDGVFRSPFSSPFGGFSYKSDAGLEAIEASIELLMAHCRAQGMAGIEITLPPLLYDFSFISKMNNCFFRSPFTERAYDLHYSIHPRHSMDNYVQSLQYNARKNLNIALSRPYTFQICATDEERREAYDVIRQNRASKEYPLRLSYDVVAQTTDILKADFFLVRLEAESVAAAIVFHTGEGIVQVIYWGDLPDYGVSKPMNFLAYKIVEHYLNAGITTIDVGSSTEGSMPNYGLCDFKESIGCIVYPKSTWAISL